MTRKITLLALVPALALGLSACSSSNTDDGEASPTSSTSPTPSPSTSATQPASPSATAEAEKAVISIKGFKYTVPASVAPGAKISITNADPSAHTVTANDGAFDVEIGPDGTATLTAPSKPGSYPFICSFHPNMTGTLVVR
ncbi:cupredoxin domain-containing protein [Knoellia sp. CPCC 206453]|uniref:cupredoxin domain-containing protein n=1 Tax=Knoellia pratensis TaxID=3404796 RepID=UPI00361F53E2